MAPVSSLSLHRLLDENAGRTLLAQRSMPETPYQFKPSCQACKTYSSGVCACWSDRQIRGRYPAGAGQVAEELMTALDVSGDGQIDHNEFIAACIDHYQLLTDHTLTAIFGEPAAFLHPLCPTAASPPQLVQVGTSHAGTLGVCLVDLQRGEFAGTPCASGSGISLGCHQAHSHMMHLDQSA